MNERTEFDDLARRKLEERQFPFDPQGWDDMERQLDAMAAPPTKRNDRRWLLAALLLLATFGGVWYAVVSSRTSVPPHEQSTAQVAEQKEGSAKNSTTQSHGTPVAPAPAIAGPAAPAPRPSRHAEPTPNETRPAFSSEAPPTRNPNTTASTPKLPSATSPATTASDVPTPQHTDPPTAAATPPTLAESTATDTLTRDPDTALNTSPTPAVPEPFLPEPTMEDPRAAHAEDQEPDEDAPPLTKAHDTPIAPENTSDTTPTDASAPAVSNIDDPSTPDSTLAATPAPPAVDSTTLVTAADSTLPRPPLYPHWEVSAWGGLFNTSTHYSGTRTTDWATTTSALQTTSFGIELMHMGTHFGVGGGLHYSTYSEHIEAEELSDATSHLVFVHELQSIDTSIMVVNGTVWLNGEQYYATYLQDTTFLVLVSTTSEETVTTVRRNALARSNRTSYLEIPLLLDAHTSAGRWGFGVRGGPMLGVLQGRRGVLPGTTGYTDLVDEAFQDLVLGWTAQGYVRYRLADSWCVGVGPAARGQLLNSMQGDALVRRSTALGGQFSISYQLR